MAVQPKPPHFSQDLIDSFVGVSPGLGLIGVVPVETLLRTKVLKPAEYPFKVIDWAAMFRLDFETTVTGDVGGTMHFISHVKLDSMILGDPSQGNAVPGTDGLNNAAYGGTDIAYDFTLHWFCAHSDSGPIDPADVRSVDHGPPAVAGLFYDTASGDVTKLRLALSPGSPTETIHCPGLDVTNVYHDFVEGFTLLHVGGPCPGIQAKNTGEPIFFVCGLLKTGDGVWTRSFHGPGNKADVPGPISIPLPPGFSASEDTTITVTQMGG